MTLTIPLTKNTVSIKITYSGTPQTAWTLHGEALECKEGLNAL